MSNVVKAITATDTGERRLKSVKSRLFQDIFEVKEDISSTQIHGEVLKQYRIGITIGNKCVVSEFDTLKSGESPLMLAIQRTKQQVIEAIFGEFRQDFRIIERHLYNYEFEEAATAVRAMEQKMFTDE